MFASSSLKRRWSSSDLQGLDRLRSKSKAPFPHKSGSPEVMLFPKDGGCLPDLQGFDGLRSKSKAPFPNKIGSPEVMLFPKDGGCLPDLQGLDRLRSKSKAPFPHKSGSPEVMLFPKDGGCLLYNPKERKQRSLGNFSGFRFLANSGKWFLVLDSGSNLRIIDMFSEKTIPLPSLESIWSSESRIKRVGNRGFVREGLRFIFEEMSSDVVRGLLWVDESGKEYVVVWFFDLPGHPYISFCKNGDTHYTDIPLFYQDDAHRWADGLSYMVLRRYHLYISSGRRYVRVLDLSGQQGSFKDITKGNPIEMYSGYERDSSIAVTTSGEVLLVETDRRQKGWLRLYKKNPHKKHPDDDIYPVLELQSLDGEALLLDLGFTVPANDFPGLKPDCIYFTRHHRPCQCADRDLDICVFNLATKDFERFPDIGNMNLMDARWFLPGN